MKLNNKIKNLLEPGQTLSQKVVRSGFWVVTFKIVERTLRFIRTVILARLLAPSDFGLFGIACLAMNTLETFTKTGFGTALVQKKERTEDFLDTAWTVSIIRGVSLFLILFFSAPLAANFFNSPKATPIIRVIATILLFGSVSNIGTVYFVKELDFRKRFIIQITRTIANVGVAIPLAFILRNTWALVWGMLAGSIVGCIMSYIIHPYRPKLHLETVKAKELFTFGKWIFASTIIIFLVTQGDDILVGKLLGVTALGFYTMAYAISNLPATEITHVISNVTFPAYSKLQDNLPKLREAYLKVLQLTAFISIPLAGGIFILASDFTRIFLGDKWMPMVPAMQVLALWGAIRSIGATTGPIFQGVGNPGIATKLQFGQLILLVILIYPFTIRWGILGASWAVVFAALIANLVGGYMVIKVTKCGIQNFCKMTGLPLINMGIMISSISILKVYWLNLIGIRGLFLFILLGILIYFGVTYLFEKFFDYRLRFTIKKSLALF